MTFRKNNMKQIVLFSENFLLFSSLYKLELAWPTAFAGHGFSIVGAVGKKLFIEHGIQAIGAFCRMEAAEELDSFSVALTGKEWMSYSTIYTALYEFFSSSWYKVHHKRLPFGHLLPTLSGHEKKLFYGAGLSPAFFSYPKHLTTEATFNDIITEYLSIPRHRPPFQIQPVIVSDLYHLSMNLTSRKSRCLLFRLNLPIRDDRIEAQCGASNTPESLFTELCLTYIHVCFITRFPK